MIAFYDCSASDEAAESDLSTAAQEGSIKEAACSESNSVTDSAEDQVKRNGASTFYRTATAGISAESKVFPSQIPSTKDEVTVPTIATHPTFLNYFRRVQATHQMLVINKKEMEPFAKHLDKTQSGDDITCIVLLPIKTSDDKLRAIAITCLNPRIQYNDAYARFLDLFKAQVSHGVTSIRLVREEL
jgi:hypothetical protein